MIEADTSLCLRCGGCVGTCPASALALTEHGIACDGERCTRCETCVRFCPVAALALKEEK
ncbi:MAG: 4Fe-4S binding protein [Candidatus Aenigmatarchaeota archaeon]